MKKIFLVVAIICGSYLTSNAQFGVKGGLNFSSNGELKELGDDIKADSKTGYHVGIMYQTKGDSFYLRPELIYTSTKSEYASRGDLTINKLDMPILLGYHVFKPISIFAGPSLQYILDTDGFNLNDAERDFTIGVQFGAAVDLGDKLTVDLRYEKGLSENLANFADISGDRVDTRPTQLILGLALKF